MTRNSYFLVMMKRFVMSGAALALLGAGCAAQSSSVATLGYSLPADGSITVTSREVDASTLVRADTLFAQAEECGYARAPQYYVDLENLFVGKTGMQYTFAIAGDYEVPTWTVTVLPNAAAYASESLFKSDFDICSAGGSLYPSAVGSANLLFTNSCGSGYSGGKENGCEVVRAAVEPTLSIE